MSNIVDNANPSPEEPGRLYIKPTLFQFDDKTEARGFLAFDDRVKTFVYPINISMDVPPYNLVHSYILSALLRCFLQENAAFEGMLQRAYLKKKTIEIIGKCDVEWYEYERIFPKTSFYEERQPARIIEAEFQCMR